MGYKTQVRALSDYYDDYGLGAEMGDDAGDADSPDDDDDADALMDVDDVDTE